jgi:hypothetical protein
MDNMSSAHNDTLVEAQSSYLDSTFVMAMTIVNALAALIWIVLSTFFAYHFLKPIEDYHIRELERIQWREVKKSREISKAGVEYTESIELEDFACLQPTGVE